MDPASPGNPRSADAAPSSAGSLKSGSGFGRLVSATRYSMHGIGSALRHEAAFRQEVLLAVVLIPLALIIDVGGIGKAMMIASVLLVLVVELLNSAIETVVDQVSPEPHPLAKRAKDLGSAAVFLSLLNVPVIWALVIFG